MKPIVYILFFFSLGFFACEQKKVLSPELVLAESIMRWQPDSALAILENMVIPDPSDKEEYATYCLLMTQALDKNYKDHHSDSLVNIAIDYFLEQGTELRKAWSLYYGGRVNEELKKYTVATAYYLDAKEIADKTDNYNLRELISTYLGTLYRKLKMYDQSLVLKREALNYSELGKDTIDIIYSLRDIAVAYDCLELYDSTMFYYEKALTYTEDVNDENLLISIHTGIAWTYTVIGESRKAVDHIRNNISYIDPERHSQALFVLGESYMNINEFDSSFYYLNYAKESKRLHTKTSAYKSLVDLERKRGNYDTAFLYNKAYLECKDSIARINLIEVVTDLQGKYDKAKLVNINTDLKLKKSKQQQNIYCIIAIVLIVFFLYYLYCRYKKNRNNRELLNIKKVIEQQKLKVKENEFMLAQNIELLTEKEIQLIENKIRNSEGANLILENEVLKSEIEKQEKKYFLSLDKNKNSFQQDNSRLYNQYEKLKSKESLLINHLIEIYPCLKNIKTYSLKHSKIPEKELEKIVDVVNELYEGFAYRLLTSYPNLTQKDILLCCLMKMNFKTTEIADLTDSMNDAIYKRQQRIRKKIGSESFISLDEFIFAF